MQFEPLIITLLMDLRRRGITDTKILSAFERVPRDMFVPENFLEQAYEDLPFPISDTEIMLPPYVLADMLRALQLTDRCKVLEIGTGTGYCSALLSKLARRVYTVEIDQDLSILADNRFKSLDLHTVMSQSGNGLKGWPGQAPFDRILIHGALPDLPHILFDQLAIGGLMVFALGEHDYDQKLVCVEKMPDGNLPKVTRLNAVKFSKLVA